MKAIALISGGLDSTLAAGLVREQGIEVVGLRFKIPFCAKTNKILPDLGIEIQEINIADDFLKLIENPKYGYGSQMNPCIDCKILMLSKAKELMEQYNAKFIITGEVLGQRPMSQHKQALETIAKRAGLESLVLRPLSAKLLPQTLPEREGWIKRQNLLDFSGRGRKQQIELAKTLGIEEYAQPAGGCLLTDPGFSKRLRDLIAYGKLNLNNIELLKIGRHFRITPETKLVVGRNEKENERLLNLAKEEDYLFMPKDIPGPTALGRGIFNEELINFSSSIICRYCDLDGSTNADIIYKKTPEQEDKILKIAPIEDSRLIELRI
jgi:tRNA U34 2-thiouridine synthase MnmA/TrmU